MAIIDIPHDTFRPYNNAKTDIIFIQKGTPQQDKVLAIKIKNIGHDHQGEVNYMYDLETDTFDKSKINDDTIKIIPAIKNKDIMSLIENNYNPRNQREEKLLEENRELQEMIKYIDYKDIEEEDVLVARNYFEEKLVTDNKVQIEDLINEGILEHFDGHGSPRGYLKGQGTYPYIRVKDIVNLEVYTNPQDLIPEFEYDRLFRSEKELKAKDIVFVRRGSYMENLLTKDKFYLL